MSTELVERLRDYAGDDHERLCQGRNYDCTCGYDERRDPLIAAAADELTALTAKVALLTEALEWYGERARLARLIHSGGDPARFELSDDGGKRARRALSEPDKEWL